MAKRVLQSITKPQIQLEDGNENVSILAQMHWSFRLHLELNMGSTLVFHFYLNEKKIESHGLLD